MSKRKSDQSNCIKRRTVLKGVPAVALFGATGASAREDSLHAQLASLGTYSEASQERTSLRFQYVVKFVCGDSRGDAVARGRYRTAINLHNPNAEPTPFRWKVAPAFTEQPGQHSDFVESGFSLESDQAFEIDCEQIFEVAEEIRQEGFLKGFVVVESNVELDVVAVYSAGTEGVQTLDVERVEPRDTSDRDDENGGNLPDLVPVPQSDVFPPFCRRNEDGDLLVVVQNQGDADAEGSVTRVEFGNGEVLKRETPPLDAGASETLTFPIPQTPVSCFRPNCPFTITVDAGDDVSESDEGNNVATSRCIG